LAPTPRTVLVDPPITRLHRLLARIFTDDRVSDWSLLTLREAVPIMRQILERYGLQDAQALTQGNGVRWPTWYDDPVVFLEGWRRRVSGADVIFVLYSDAIGPACLLVLAREADAVRLLARVGPPPPPLRLAILIAVLRRLGLERMDQDA
jgi:hypothetical protein